ncbi:hypothetical protein [Lysinibacillus sp. NPDC096259]|uniref:hypothetical protein n=1 Tax=Lysinibacillus sp. NPDC096259 TaxID=3390583 RepID=UPI003D08F319
MRFAFAKEQRLLGASDEQLHSRCSLRGLGPTDVFLRESEEAPVLVMKALSQDVMVLVFVPHSLIPKESPNLHYNQLI